jgi:L-cysteine:1D-myo-inositol 2-amino-2-deoxy-alpha-D-glucopyranoside ligase
MVRYQGEKMSKSLGNLVFVSDLIKDWDPMAVRLALLDHDRRDWEWDDGLLEVAAVRLERWRAADSGAGGVGGVRAALDDDLDLPAALAEIDAAAENGGVSEAASLLGVRLSGHAPE